MLVGVEAAVVVAGAVVVDFLEVLEDLLDVVVEALIVVVDAFVVEAFTVVVKAFVVVVDALIVVVALGAPRQICLGLEESAIPCKSEAQSAGFTLKLQPTRGSQS
eukprot:NODE_239_length_13273_cov_0.404964.p8 type:complete len:105 gc:universal NODE_239_length_13273_cov_0.404964:6309-6623(+)